MKKPAYIFLQSLAAAFLIALPSCEDIINPELEQADAVLVVDAWLNNKPGQQVIKLTTTQPYFENLLPPGVQNAAVQVNDLTSGTVYVFRENANAGEYQWTPAGNETFGAIGHRFELVVQVGSEEYRATSRMGRVPPIDSISFTFQPATQFFPESFFAEFWATDPVGSGDTYWIKAFKNGVFLKKPSELNVAFDAGFSEGGNADGVTFITPIRTGVNPNDVDANGNPLPPFRPGDSLWVEIHSISRAAFNFLNQVVIQTDRPGGFSELFATPLANVATNIVNTRPGGPKAVGFFNTAAVSGKGRGLRVN
jgi:hypothetical protein